MGTRMLHRTGTPLALLTLLLIFSTADAEVAPAFDEWAVQNDCSSVVPASQRDADPRVLPISETATRLLGFARGLEIANPWTRFTLENVCRSIRLPLVDMPLPPPRAEPWNPNPPAAMGASYVAILQSETATFSQYIEYRDLPSVRDLSLSVIQPRDPAAPFEIDRPDADMGARCKLRAEAVRDALAPAGFTMTADFEAPASSAGIEAKFPREPSVSFARGEVTVSVRMQGSFASQRAQKLHACVAGLTVSVENPVR